MAEALLMIFSLAFMPSDHPKPASNHHNRYHPHHAKNRTTTKSKPRDNVPIPQSKEHHLLKKVAKRAACALRHKVDSLGQRVDSRLYKGSGPDDTINTRQRKDLREDHSRQSIHARHPTSRSPLAKTDLRKPGAEDTINTHGDTQQRQNLPTRYRDRISSATLRKSGQQQRQSLKQQPTSPAPGHQPRPIARGQDWVEDLDITGPSFYDDMFYGNCHI
ncbi:hypothetical protein GE09DRAFT_457166 [Coniochaeta sp. 2T2.1]|nr:hypothetical protein GE09DRAFT_457166 [Coniochaeta sp. 2T2.1]